LIFKLQAFNYTLSIIVNFYPFPYPKITITLLKENAAILQVIITLWPFNRALFRWKPFFFNFKDTTVEMIWPETNLSFHTTTDVSLNKIPKWREWNKMSEC